ncbi:MAG: FliA/WhiG family RNA polymerase sigma factor [Proteobacteria bacterium]|nr:FliA/WhiG family RNA polymerase sigma factor [Pseudomonadota bacterium]
MWKRAYAQNIEDERERIVEEFIPIIKHLAYKVSKGFEEKNMIEDLISAGIVGLLEAIDKYDTKRGAKLNTFAYLRIRGAMIDELRSRDWFPRSARSKAKKIEEVIRKLENRLGRYPKEEEIAEEMHIDFEDYLSLMKDYKNLSILSIEDLHESIGEDREKIISYVTDESDDPEKYAEFHELEEMLAKEIERLPEKQKIVLSLYYHEDMNMKEIARTLSITEARVCQIHSQAIISLRSILKKRIHN